MPTLRNPFFKCRTKLSDFRQIIEAIRWQDGTVTLMDQNGKPIRVRDRRYESVRRTVFGDAPPYCEFYHEISGSLRSVPRSDW